MTELGGGPGGHPFELESYLSRERLEVKAALNRALPPLLGELHPTLRDPVRDGVLTAGKRLRPILCVAAYRACIGGAGAIPGRARTSRVHDFAVSLELIHAYSLMHDDLPCMDDAPLRRGKPTPHTIHGVPATLIGGAALIPAAGLHLWRSARELGLDQGASREALRVLCVAAGAVGMVGGQGLDLLGEGVELVPEELDALHSRKTGALLTAALTLGAIVADASPRERAALERYGRAVGLAFQIADDILDATSDAARLGKEPSDAAREKSTYVALLGLDRAREEGEALVAEAESALRDGGIDSLPLSALAAHLLRRDR